MSDIDLSRFDLGTPAFNLINIVNNQTDKFMRAPMLGLPAYGAKAGSNQNLLAGACGAGRPCDFSSPRSAQNSALGLLSTGANGLAVIGGGVLCAGGWTCLAGAPVAAIGVDNLQADFGDRISLKEDLLTRQYPNWGGTFNSGINLVSGSIAAAKLPGVLKFPIAIDVVLNGREIYDGINKAPDPVLPPPHTYEVAMNQDAYLSKLAIIYALGLVIFLCGIPLVRLMKKKGLKDWIGFFSAVIIIPFVFVGDKDNTIVVQGVFVTIFAYIYYWWDSRKLNTNKTNFEEKSAAELINPTSMLPKPIVAILLVVRTFTLLGYFLYIVSPQGSWASWFGLVIVFIFLEAILFYVIKQLFPKYDFVKYQWKIDLK